MADLPDIIAAIMSASEDDFKIIDKALTSRRKTLTDAKTLEQLTDVYVGDKVITHNDIRPVWMRSLIGEVTAIDPSSEHPFTVNLLPSVWVRGREKRRIMLSGNSFDKVD